MRLNFTVYGSQYTYGWLPEGAALIAAADFLAEARRRGFHGAELPDRMLQVLSDRDLLNLRATAERYDLELVVSTFGTDVDHLREQVRKTSLLGASLVRTVVGGAGYGGDRRAFRGRWPAFMEEVRERFARVITDAERRGVVLAVENHQDVNSEDLLALCHGFESQHFGVVLDVANPLAVAEHPVDFAFAVMPYIKYVHLKDYVIYWSQQGYRLVRCPVGAGAVPLNEIIALLNQHARAPSASLELAALDARHVRVFEEDFWPEYPVRSAAQFARVMAFVRRHARTETEEYRTPFEKGATPQEIAAYEEEELQASIRLAAALTDDATPLQALRRAQRASTD